jgi:hypothetical protein
VQHVMVPVPEEHLAEFQGDLMRLALGMSGWDDAAVRTLLDSLADHGDQTLFLLRIVAEAGADHRRVTYASAATAIEVTVGDVLQLVIEINDHCEREGLPHLVITTSAATAGADGAPGSTPVLMIVPPVARKVLSLWPSTASPAEDAP